MLLIRCICGNNLLIDTEWPLVSNDFSCFCWPGTNTWTQDMQAAVSAKPADMRGEGHRRGKGQVKWKRHVWTAAVPQWAARRENHGPRSCSVYERKVPLLRLFFYVIFYSADITGIEYLGFSQQMWSHTQADTDLCLCLFCLKRQVH